MKIKSNYKAYAGIGSRSTPADVLDQMTTIATQLEEEGYILRTGGADGADTAFLDGIQDPNTVELYLPWQGFNGYESNYPQPTKAALDLAAKYHPNWSKCSPNVRKFHARNSHQILGYHLDSPVDFVLCYTPKGDCVGGTAQAIRIADSELIPVINFGLGIDYALNELDRLFEKLYG